MTLSALWTSPIRASMRNARILATTSRKPLSSAAGSSCLHPGPTLTTTSTWRTAHGPFTRHPPLPRRSMFIQTETPPNDDSLKFIPGVPVMSRNSAEPLSTGSAEFLDTSSALRSPLAIRLMNIEGVRGVFYGPDFVTVSKDSEYMWSVMKPEIYSTLMEHFTSGQPLFRCEADKVSAGPRDTEVLDSDSETVAMIKELLDTRLRPEIMKDGGDIEYKGFDEGGTGIVKLMLKGSCRGCDSSSVTLKTGIERMLMHYIPEVKGVEQVMGEEEIVAMDEFSKFEQKLAQRGAKRDSNLAQYMSV